MIDEKALVRLTKEAYKDGGIRIWRTDIGGADALLITSGFWTVSAPMTLIPSKELGVITEYLRRLPLCGEAFNLRKGVEPPEKLDRKALPYDLIIRDDFVNDCKLTEFSVGGLSITQTRDQHFVGIDMERLALVGGYANMGRATASRQIVHWRDVDSGERVWIVPSPIPPAALDRIKGQDFWRNRNE